MAKILLIDDSKTSIKNLIDSLRELAGIEFFEAKNGQEGLDSVAKNKPDCVVCDLNMPGTDGYFFLENLRKSGNAVPVIIVSADVSDASRSRVLSLGAHSLLKKPIFGLPSELKNIVKAVLKI